MADRVIFSTFYHRTLPIIKKYVPSSQCAMIVGSFWVTLVDEGIRTALDNLPLLFQPKQIIRRAERLGVSRLHIKKSLVSEDFLRSAHDAGLSVYVWTVNKPEEIARFKAMGVDGIISDFPERL